MVTELERKFTLDNYASQTINALPLANDLSNFLRTRKDNEIE